VEYCSEIDGGNFPRVSSWRSNVVVFVGQDNLRRKKAKMLEESLQISILVHVDHKRTLLCWNPINTSNQTFPQLSSSRPIVSSQKSI
jgi:hypothetical protein